MIFMNYITYLPWNGRAGKTLFLLFCIDHYQFWVIVSEEYCSEALQNCYFTTYEGPVTHFVAIYAVQYVSLSHQKGFLGL